MKKVIVIFIVIVSALLISSCGSTKVTTQTVRESLVDTVYLSNIQHDSIYVYQSHDRDYHPAARPLQLGTLQLGTLKPDIVFVKDVSVEYRYKLLRDTIRIIQRDSIPYEVTIVETKEITRPLTWFDHLTRACFWLLIGVLFVLFVRAVYHELCRRVFNLISKSRL